MKTSKNKQTLKSLLMAGTFIAGSALPTLAASYKFLGNGPEVRSELNKTAKDAKCGSNGKMKDGKCGQGKCGSKSDSTHMKGMNKSHGKMKDGKCGQGKCGSNKTNK